METIIIKKNDYTQIQISESEYQGQKYIHIREYYLDRNTDEYHPTKKGIAFTLTLWDEFLKKLKQKKLL